MTSIGDLSTRLDALEHALHVALHHPDSTVRTRWLTSIQAAADTTRHELAATPAEEEARPHPVLHLISPAASAPGPPLPGRTRARATWSAARSLETPPLPWRT